MTSIQLDVSEIMHCLFCGTKKWTSFPKKWGIPFRHGKRNLLLYLHRSYTKHLETQNLEVILSACMKRKFGKHSTTGRFFIFMKSKQGPAGNSDKQSFWHFKCLPLIRWFSPATILLRLLFRCLHGLRFDEATIWWISGQKYTLNISCSPCHLSKTQHTILSFTLMCWALF